MKRIHVNYSTKLKMLNDQILQETQTLEAIRDSSNLYCLRNIKKKLYAEKEQQHSSHTELKGRNILERTIA